MAMYRIDVYKIINILLTSQFPYFTFVLKHLYHNGNVSVVPYFPQTVIAFHYLTFKFIFTQSKLNTYKF